MPHRIKVGITMGDPSGIGPEIIAKAIKNPSINRIADFIIIGDEKTYQKVNKHPVRNVKFIDLGNVPSKSFAFGKIKQAYGKASVEYIQEAVVLLKRKDIDCLVTCPISKEAMQLAGFKWSGHTELLAELCGVSKPLMVLVNQYLKFALVTRHIALKKVPLVLTQSAICNTFLLAHKAMKQMFGESSPRIVALALNPHASDGGMLGKEEEDIIIPAVKKMQKRNLFFEGPLPADSGIQKLLNKEYDCALAMYHDQALIALKLTDAESGVNLTYGLPYVRTSPLHGTAFNIAGKDIANPNSLIWAIKLAVQCARNLKNA
jgi:4-hydroxythreonine-4-phosphate dehydrogenase